MAVSDQQTELSQAARGFLAPRPHDAAMMRLALAEAEKGRGLVSPNPLVGAVVVDETTSIPHVLATGFHAAYGQAHAEVSALGRLGGASAREKTLYVTLEPCNHVGKTGKCTDALLAAGLGRVVVGLLDPNPRVAGGGVQRLRQAGVAVQTGVCEDECRQQNRGYLQWLSVGRPWLLLKAAIALDGRLAVSGGRRQFLTGAQAARKVHALRAAYDAIVVGAATVRADDPQLTARGADPVPTRQPLRVVIDGALSVPVSAQVVGPGTLFLTSEPSFSKHSEKVRALQARGAEVETIPRPARDPSLGGLGTADPGNDTDIDLRQALTLLGKRGILYALCEGGGKLHGAFLAAQLYDEAALFVAPLFLGASGVPLLGDWSCPAVDAAPWLERPTYTPLGADCLIEGTLRRSPFSPQPQP